MENTLEEWQWEIVSDCNQGRIDWEGLVKRTPEQQRWIGEYLEQRGFLVNGKGHYLIGPKGRISTPVENCTPLYFASRKQANRFRDVVLYSEGTDRINIFYKSKNERQGRLFD